MTDESGQTRYCYDRRGNIVRKVQITAGETLVLRYGYDLADRLVLLVYPSGLEVYYDRDALGRIVEVTARRGDVATPIVTGVNYSPFGPLAQLTFGDGSTLTKRYDHDYAIDHIDASSPNGLDLEFELD